MTPEEPSTSETQPASSRITIFEDNPIDIDLLKHAFKQHGAEVILEAVDNAEAAERFFGREQTGPPNLIVLDLHFPSFNGESTLGRLRAHPTLSKSAVAVLSSSASPRERAELLAWPVSFYQTKPMNWEGTLRLAAKLLDLCSAGRMGGREKSNALKRLKERTEDLHRRIESVVPLTDAALTLDGYAAYLERLYPFYRSIETHLKSVPGLRTAVRDLDQRWKTDLLERDLRALGKWPAATKENPRIPDLQTVAQGLGCLYVLEGSTLGGQILIRMVREKFGDQVAGKANFLESYGKQISAKWIGLCSSITAGLATPLDEEAAVASARCTFSCLHDWLAAHQTTLKVASANE